MQNDSQYPWIFQRDEIDLLEEDIEDIYQRFGKDNSFGIENIVIQEQMETEELSDVEFTVRMSEIITEDHPPKIPEFVLDEQFDLKKNSTEELKRNPLYDWSLRWANSLFDFAKDLYENKGKRTEHVFRVYFNVKFVPIKLSITFADDDHPEFSIDIAEKEFELANIYIKRVLDSLYELVFYDREKVYVFLTEGERIKKTIQDTLEMIRKRKQSRLNFFL